MVPYLNTNVPPRMDSSSGDAMNRFIVIPRDDIRFVTEDKDVDIKNNVFKADAELPTFAKDPKTGLHGFEYSIRGRMR